MSMPLRCAQKVALLFVAFSALMVSPVTAAAISLTPSPDAAEQPTTTLPTRGGNFDFSNGIDNKTEVESRQAAIKVMIVGDSISQGHEGDWTWRYRLWQWFQSEGVAVDFVGPYTGTWPPDSPNPPEPPPLLGSPPAPSTAPKTNGGYAVGTTPGWNSNHFSVWGRQAAQDQGLIQAQVQAYQPDYLLVELGFNDMGWFISDAQGTLQSMQLFVANARAAKPDLKFAIANVPQRLFIGGREDLVLKTDQYNELLPSALVAWSTPNSPIALVEFRENYACDITACPAGHDGLHPNALGEYQIAQAFANTLHGNFGLGSSSLAIPDNIPARPMPVPTNVKAVATPLGITVTWDAVYGAFGYDVQNKLTSLPDWTVALVDSNRYDTTWTLDGWEWEYQVRVNNDELGVSDWSDIVSAISQPQTPGPPNNIVTAPTTTGINAVWNPPSGAYSSPIDSYAVLIFDNDVIGAWLAAYGVTGQGAEITGLVPGHHYTVAVVAWGPNGGGWPGIARGVTVDAGYPPAPTNFQVTSTDATTVQLAWCGSPAAAGYRVWIRDINNSSSVLASADQYGTTGPYETSYGIEYLIPGVWNYEFCVTAINGYAESPLSNCEVAPHPPASVGGPVGGSGCFAGPTRTTGDSWPTGVTDGPPPAWQTVTCADPDTTNIELDPLQRWNDLDTDSAWEAAVASWEQYKTTGGTDPFVEIISNFFVGPSNMLCVETVDHNGCSGLTIECGSVEYPAGAFILNSLIQIFNVNINLYDALSRAESQMTSQMSTFSSTFAPIESESAVEAMILNFISLGFSLATSPALNFALKDTAFFIDHTDELGGVVNTVSGLIGTGISIGQGLVTSGDGANPVDVQNTLEVSMGNMVTLWYNTIDGINSQLFDGSDASIGLLQQMITGGRLIQVNGGPSDLQYQQYIYQAIYVYLIPQGWSLSDEGIFPFILDSGFPCSAINPLPQYMSDADGDASYICYNNQLYYLMTTTGSAQTCHDTPCGIPLCTNNLFTVPPGLSSLDGTQWGGIIRDDFIIGALNGYQSNNNQNGWPAAVVTSDPNDATVQAIYNTGIRTPGIVQIPVCGPDVAFYNWLSVSSSTPNFPCTPIPPDAKARREEEEKREIERRGVDC